MSLTIPEYPAEDYKPPLVIPIAETKTLYRTDLGGYRVVGADNVARRISEPYAIYHLHQWIKWAQRKGKRLQRWGRR